MSFTQYTHSKPKTQPLGAASDIQIVGDEDGWNLIIHADAGVYVVNIHSIAEDFLANANSEIGGWLEEGGRARAERRHDAEQRDAYDLRDPKSPDWHSVNADRYDTMRGDR